MLHALVSKGSGSFRRGNVSRSHLTLGFWPYCLRLGSSFAIFREACSPSPNLRNAPFSDDGACLCPERFPSLRVTFPRRSCSAFLPGFAGDLSTLFCVSLDSNAIL